MMGRLGVGSAMNPCTMNVTTNVSTLGRRLSAASQKGNNAAASANKAPEEEEEELLTIVDSEEEEDLVQRLLMVELEDTLLSVAMILGSVFGAHALLLLAWKIWCNRRYYAWVRRTPKVIKIEKQAGASIGISERASFHTCLHVGVCLHHANRCVALLGV